MKKIINKHFELEDKIYHSVTDVIIGDWEYFTKFLRGREIEPDVQNKEWIAETGTIINDDGTLMNYYIRIPAIDFTTINYCTIVHELSHLSFYVLDRAGIKFGAENQEPFTYLLEMFLSDFLTKAMKLYK